MNKYSRQPGDSILALLEPGEYVLNRNAVNEIGREKLDDLNYEDAPRFDMSQRGQFQVAGMLGDMIGMQAGGSTLEYGGATTETQSLEDIYRQNNMVPNRQQRPGFEEKWAYDPSREGVIFEDYGRAMTGATQKGQQNLMGAGQKMQQSQAKAGFAGAGAGQQAQQQARGNIMQDFLAQEGAAKSTLFKDVRAERERWATDVTGALGTLEGQGGTSPYDTNVTETAGGEQYQSQEAWYQLGFPDETSWQNWVTAGSNPEEMGQYGQDPQAAASNLATTTGLSDVRLKKDINYIFTMENGVPIYTFKYKWSDDVNIGTMAQDIEDMIPEAVSTNSAGYKMVNYSKVFNYGKI